MYAQSTPLPTRAPLRIRRIAAATVLSAILALMAALPATPARASTTRLAPDAMTPGDASKLPSEQVEEVLASVPLKDLNASELSTLLSQLPGLSILPAGPLQEALSTAIETAAGEEATLEQVHNPAELAAHLATELESRLSPVLLASLITGESLTSLLTNALGSPESNALIGELTSSSSKPEQLMEQVFADLDPGKLQALLDTTLTGEPFIKTTVGALASSMETTDTGLAEALGTSVAALPASTMALTTPLTDGRDLAVLDGTEGLDLATLVPPSNATPGGPGGQGGPGGASAGDSNTTPGATTVVVNVPGQGAPASSPGANPGTSKVKIIGRKVRGNTVTVVVQVPGAGTLTLAGSGVRSVRQQTSRAERFTLRTALTRAGVSSRHRHRRGITVRLKASFRSIDGHSSSTTTAVTFG